MEDRRSILVTKAFVMLGRLHDVHEVPNPEMLYRGICDVIDELFREAQQHGVSERDTNDFIRPVIALADELATNVLPENVREYWECQEPIQLIYLKTANLGEEFFEAIDRIRGSRHCDLGTLENYYIALVVGFMGRYRHREERAMHKRYVQDLRDELEKGRRIVDEPLSPHGPRPPGEFAARNQVPFFEIMTVFVMLTALAMFVGWRLDYQRAVKRTADALEDGLGKQVRVS